MKHSRPVFGLGAGLVLGLTLLTGCESFEGGGSSMSGGFYYGAGFHNPWYYGRYGYDRPGMVVPPPVGRPVAPMNPIARPPTPSLRPMPSMPSMPRPATR